MLLLFKTVWLPVFASTQREGHGFGGCQLSGCTSVGSRGFWILLLAKLCRFYISFQDLQFNSSTAKHISARKKREWDQAKQHIAMGHEYEERYTLNNEEVGILLHMHPLSLSKIKRHKTIPTYPKFLFAKEYLEWRHWRVSQIPLESPPLATWNSNPMPWTERRWRSSLQCSVPGSCFDIEKHLQSQLW